MMKSNGIEAWPISGVPRAEGHGVEPTEPRPDGGDATPETMGDRREFRLIDVPLKSRGGGVRMAALVARALLAAASLSTTAWADASKPVVVELFTSQGCSSCPPADRILGRLADREDVVALGFHVKYWDRLGWRDRFATEAGTERQYAYRPALGRHNVYTPQMVIDGRYDVVGSYAERIEAAIVQANAMSAKRLAVSLVWRGPTRLAYSLPAGEGAGQIMLMRFARKLDQDISRGENAGRHISYSNVVREIVEVGRWDGAAVTGEVEVDTAQDKAGGIALLVQDSRTLRMLGAAKLTF
ncbi:MAG: DUF1223 domain-containing protein [Alphaproteobacteria bacterium]|nr:DUF1223 domain-containing protein [Alphaproteobacteria bacterium]